MKHKVLLILILFSIFCMSSNCKKNIEDMPFTLHKQPYNGNSLRLDGYYYQEKDGYYYVAHFFYNNGIILYIGGRYNYQELINMEKEITNGQLTQKLKDNKYCWGLFKIEDKDILFERYYNTDDISKKAYVRSGLIINDTTFSITKSIRSDGTQEKNIDEIYYFRQFSPKPDSTNRWIK